MPIPKIIYQTWKTHELHSNCIRVRNQIQALNPEYEMKLFNDIEIDLFIKDNFDDTIYSCFKKLKIGAAKADFWRYCVLFINGGVYLDMDSEIIRPLKELIKGDEQCIISREGNPGIFVNWLMMFDKGHPILWSAIQKCCHNITHKISPSILALTGPLILTSAINEILLPIYKTPCLNLYNESDINLNSCIDLQEHPIRARFYGVDFNNYAKFKHSYTKDLYNGHIPWALDKAIYC